MAAMAGIRGSANSGASSFKFSSKLDQPAGLNRRTAPIMRATLGPDSSMGNFDEMPGSIPQMSNNNYMAASDFSMTSQQKATAGPVSRSNVQMNMSATNQFGFAGNASKIHANLKPRSGVVMAASVVEEPVVSGDTDIKPKDGW